MRAKYGNRVTGKYHSRKESRRAEELRLLEKLGEISGLEEQVRYEIVPKQEGERAAHYVADFVYITKSGCLVVEDVKGVKTREYILKRKLMLQRYEIKISEV